LVSLVLRGWDSQAPLPPILGENKNQSPPNLGDLGGFFEPIKIN
jgi:hypothetical protein